MNPLAALIALFAQLKVDLSARFNAALANRPPLEAVEGANVALQVLRELDWGRERIERLGTELQATLSAAASVIPGFQFNASEPLEVAAGRLIDLMRDEAASKAISAAIAAKTHLPIEDHQTAVDQAVQVASDNLRTELETGFNARLEQVRLIAERRTDLVARMGAVAASSLADADLIAEDHEARIAAVESRITRLSEAGITAEAKPKSFASLMACGMDDAGTTEFEARLETIKEASSGIDLRASAPGTPRPSTPAGVVPSGETEKRSKIVI